MKHSSTVTLIAFSAFSIAGCSQGHDEGIELGVKSELLAIGSNYEVSLNDTLHPGSSIDYQSEQSMVNTGSRLVVGYNDLTGMVDHGTESLVPRYSRMGLSVSTDGGLTWTPKAQLSSTALVGPGQVGPIGINLDPWLATDARGLHVWYSMMGSYFDGASAQDRGIFLSQSTDGGGTWSDAQFKDTGPGSNIDKPSMAINQDDANQLHIAYVRMGVGIFVWTSHNGGSSFDAPVQIPYPDAQHPSANVTNPIIRTMRSREVGGPDSIWVSFEDFDSPPYFGIHVAKSTNNGASFTMAFDLARNVVAQPVRAINPLTVANGPMIHDFVVDQSSPCLEFVWFDNGLLWYAHSFDGIGWDLNWGALTGIPLATRWQPTIASDNNRTAVTWYQQPLNSPATDVYALTGTIDGFTGGPAPTRLTRNGTLSGTVPFAACVTNYGYFGDYMGLVWRNREDHSFYATWADSRRGCVAGEYDKLLSARNQHTVGNWFR